MSGQYGRGWSSKSDQTQQASQAKPASFRRSERPFPTELGPAPNIGFDFSKIGINHPTTSQPIQAKLAIGSVDGEYEQEADRVAAQVVQAVNTPEQSQHQKNDQVQAQFPNQSIQREAEGDEELQMKPVMQRQSLAAGGEASEALEASIQQSQGKGQPLEKTLQAKMGQAMGADFSGVRVHTDSHSDQLNQSVQAKAFTTGQDIFFRQGAYSPESRHGQELIAHELTHVVQQNPFVQRKSLQQKPAITGLNPQTPSLSRSMIQMKMSWDNTQWNDANYLESSRGGGGGVLFVGEAGKEIVVKPGEESSVESAMASMLLNDVSSGNVIAPGLRIVSNGEANQIANALEPLVENAIDGVKGRTRHLVDRLTEPGTVVQDLAKGEELKDLVENRQKHTKKKLFGGRKLRKNSPLKMFTDRNTVKGLGQATAVDLFTGNKDRLFQFNPENFKVENQSISFIDNIWMGTEQSYFKDTEIEGRGGNKFTVTADEGLQSWKSDNRIRQFAQGDYQALAQDAYDKVVNSAAQSTRAQDSNSFADVMKPYKARFINYFAEGLMIGKQRLIDSINKVINNPELLTQRLGDTDEDSAQQVIATMTARKNFLEGNG